MFGGKAKEDKKKNANVRGVVKARVEDLDKDLPKSVLEELLKINLNIPKNIKDIITWESGSDVPFSFVRELLNESEKISGKIEKNNLFCRYFLAVLCSTPKDIIPLAFLILGYLRPKHEGVKMNVADELIKKSILSVFGISKERVQELLKETGDLSQICDSLKLTQQSLIKKEEKQITIRSVYKVFCDIANKEGDGSTKFRLDLISKLLSEAKQTERKYIVRMIQDKLRTGAAQETYLHAMGMAFKEYEFVSGKINKKPDDDELNVAGKQFRKLFNKHPIIDHLLSEYIIGGYENAYEKCTLQIMVPVVPMLAKPSKSISEITRRLGSGRLTGEYKYDGERAQIHKNLDGKISIYSRNCDDSTAKFADISQIISTNFEGDTFIIDSEIVAINTERGEILPFQVLSNRSKKGNDGESKIQVCIFVFDLLYHNGRSLIDTPLKNRRELMQKYITTVPNRLETAVFRDSDNLEELEDFFKEAIRNKTEGLMLKNLESVYEPGKRSQLWAKLKKDYVKSFKEGDSAAPPDSIDVVVIGATYGEGKRTNTYGSFLVALRNETTGKYEALTFVGTGFSEEDLENYYKELHPLERNKCPPDVYTLPLKKKPIFFEPKIVWEITYADIQKSPEYVCGSYEFGTETGISVRFCRYLRRRPDKDPENCTTSQQLIELYYDQA